MTTIPSNSYYNLGARYVAADPQSAFAGTGEQSFADVSNSQEGPASATSKAPEATGDNPSSTATAKFQDKLAALSGLHSGSEVALSPIWEWSEAEYQEFMETQRASMEREKRALEMEHSQPPDTSNDPRLKTYATVVVGGRTVATVDNQGVVSTDNDALAKRIQKILEDQVDSGPNAAKAVAEQIAKLVGGKVDTADTAMTQADFERLVQETQPQVNYDEMMADPRYQDLQAQKSDLDEMEKQRAEHLSQKA